MQFSVGPHSLISLGICTPDSERKQTKLSPASDRVTHGESVHSLVLEERKDKKERQFKALYDEYEDAEYIQGDPEVCPLSGLQQKLLTNKYLKPIVFTPAGSINAGPTRDVTNKKDKNVNREDLDRLRAHQLKRAQDPLFTVLTKRVARIRARIDQLERKIKTTKNVGKLLNMMAEVERLVNAARSLLDRQFRMFATIIGVHVEPTCMFTKGAFDSAMEECFGSLERPGTGLFKYPGMTRLRLADPLGPHKIFSLYLSRKAFTFASPTDLEAGLDKFFKRVCKPINESDRDPELVQRAYTLMEAVATSLFQEQRSKRKPYNSGKACYEVPKSEGGKRAGEYVAENFEGRRRVRPAAIWSSGKVRVITVDSCFNTRFSFLNKYMGDEIRKCGWSIFGRTVEDWLEANPEFLRPRKEGENFVSGDLESATDLFDPQFARIVIKRLTDIYPEIEGVENPYEEMCSFTCDAKLDIPGTAEEKTDERTGRKYFTGYPATERQRRGQLMGSVLSFPILCLVGLVSYLLERPEGRVVLSLFEKYQTLRACGASSKDYSQAERALHEVREYIRSIKDVGINGDDIVFRGNKEDSEKWERGVRTVGGVVSRGKTLCNPNYFTVNSELCSDRGVLDTMRPSLAVSLSDGKYKTPDPSWFRYLTSPLRSTAADDIFKPELSLYPNMPKFFGGLGKKQLSAHEFDFRGFLTLLESRPKAVYDFNDEHRIDRYGAKKNEGIVNNCSFKIFVNKDSFGHNVIDPCNVPLPAGDEYREGLVDRGALHEFLKLKYTKSPTTIMWDCPGYTAPNLDTVNSMVDRQLEFLDLQDARELYSLYKFGYEMDRQGLALYSGTVDESLEVQEFSSMSPTLARGLESYKARRKATMFMPKPEEDPANPDDILALRNNSCFATDNPGMKKDCDQPPDYLIDSESAIALQLREQWRGMYFDPLEVGGGSKFNARAVLMGREKNLIYEN